MAASFPASSSASLPEPVGPRKVGEGAYAFRLWAPRAQAADLVLVEPERRVLAMRSGERGWFEIESGGLGPDTRYAFSLDSGSLRPDPASHFQPEGVHAPSALVDHNAYEWRSGSDFRPPPLRELILYELHIGAFTPEGTFAAATSRLDDLVDLGVNAVEVMPLAQFPGGRNWGYDGVNLFAVQSTYGGPEGFKAFVDACHRRGLAVILDVVYNHLGPEGNYLREFGPYFTRRYTTPWGEAMNFDGSGSDGVRNHICANMLHWFERYRVDGLRLDAVHAIYDQSPRHILALLADVRETWAEDSGKRPLLIAESHLNRPQLVEPRALNGYGLDAMWADDFHHATHALITGEDNGYYMDYGDAGQLADTVRNNFCFEGGHSRYWGRAHGADGRHLEPWRIVNFLQTHDMTGNRMRGERLASLTDFETLKTAAALFLLAPHTPLLFMGEEYGEDNPFLYFVSHGDEDLIRAVREGRAREFAGFGWQGDPPDPQDPATMRTSVLSWDKRAKGTYAVMLAFYRHLIGLRRELPVFGSRSASDMEVGRVPGESALTLRRRNREQELFAVFHFGSSRLTLDPGPCPAGRVWTRILHTAETRWSGPGVPDGPGPDDASITLERQSTVLLLSV